MPTPSVPLARAPKAIIAAIEITRHRLNFDPPFHASWDTKPRAFWDAAIVAVHTDLGGLPAHLDEPHRRRRQRPT